MYIVNFEVDVNGVASVKRYNEIIYISAETPKAARDKAELYIKTAYSDNFAILEVKPLTVIE